MAWHSFTDHWTLAQEVSFVETLKTPALLQGYLAGLARRVRAFNDPGKPLDPKTRERLIELSRDRLAKLSIKS